MIWGLTPMDGLLLTGVFGSGKSTLAAEIAEMLERNSVAYGAIDLDWLLWFDVPGMDRAQATAVYLRNVAAVVEGHRSIGVEHVVLAGAVRDRYEVDVLERATGVALRVVRLTVPIADIEQRLASDPTTGRRDDLRVAAEWLSDSVGVGIEDLAVANDGPPPRVAEEILGWLGWLPPGPAPLS